MGVFYHLRYPLLALDIVAEKVSRYLIFQSVAIGECGSGSAPEDVNFQTLSALECPSWPQMAFVEHTFCHDATNWWIPNRAAVAGMLRSTGMRIEIAVDADTLICSPDGSKGGAIGIELNCWQPPGRARQMLKLNLCIALTLTEATPARQLTRRRQEVSSSGAKQAGQSVRARGHEAVAP